jgi:hypothetical protein
MTAPAFSHGRPHHQAALYFRPTLCTEAPSMAEFVCDDCGHRNHYDPAEAPNVYRSFVPGEPDTAAMSCHRCGTRNVVPLPPKPTH